MPFFYFTAVIIWLIAFFSGGPTGAVILAMTMLLVLAVNGLDQRIRFAIDKIQNPELDIEQHLREEWWGLARWISGWIGLLLMGTIAIGLLRCLLSGEELTVSCIWSHMVDYWLE